MCLASYTNNYRSLFDSLLSVFDLKYPTLR